MRLEQFILLGHSVGVAFAIGTALANPTKVCGLILCDYPPLYPAFNDTWVERVLQHEVDVSPRAVKSLAKESEQIVFREQLAEITVPTLILRGGKPASLLPQQIVEFYSKLISHCKIIKLDSAGHELFLEAKAEFVALIESFGHQN